MNYAFEEFEDLENSSVIFRGIVGSRAYGTANAQSDTDTRGIFVVPSMEYVRLVPPPKQVSDAHNDHTYYSLLRFCELMAEANPTTMEMLYLPEDCIITTTPAFETLVAHRDMFITQRAVASHLGYAVSQMKKAKGANKRVWNPWPEEPPTPEDYCMFLRDAHELPKPLKKSGVDLRTCLATRLSKSVTEDVMHVYDYGKETGGVFRGGAPVVSSIPKEDAGLRIGVLIFNKQAFESAKRQHRKYWDWRRHRNDARWVQQERGQLDYDAKNMMHLTRLREKYELFFEREAYESGLIRMLKDISEHPGIYNSTRGSSYAKSPASFVEHVHDTLQRRSYFQDMWKELEGTR